ncbi:MAG: hypothetical protein LUQ11_08600 [Methylococcaceae bacterium]|nr:hypothetical protein [Methylococcaceae bacterium]
MTPYGLHLTALQLSFAATAAEQQPATVDYSLDAVKQKVISVIVAGWDAYSICEQVDRSNPTAYVAKLLAANQLPSSAGAITARYFVVRKQTEAVGVDFSLYRIQYASDEAAMRALNSLAGKTGALADGKVLTRYALQLNANSLDILRTQSFLDPAMKSLLESFATEEFKLR